MASNRVDWEFTRGNLRRRHIVLKCCSNTIALKAISCPLARGREIEFVIFRFALLSDKRLKTGVLPKAIRSARRLRQRDSETHQIPFENISKSECVVRVQLTRASISSTAGLRVSG